MITALWITVAAVGTLTVVAFIMALVAQVNAHDMVDVVNERRYEAQRGMDAQDREIRHLYDRIRQMEKNND
jgi:hypothetical protein